MQIQYPVQQPGKSALRSGAVIGIPLGVIHSVITIVVTQMSMLSLNLAGRSGDLPTITVVLYLLTPLIWIVGFLAAGAWAGRDAGKISAGVLAGLFAGTFGGIIAGVGQVVATALASTQQSPTSSSLILVSGFAAVFYVMVLALGAGAGFGVLGGLIGQSISPVRSATQPLYAQPVIPYTFFPAQQPQAPFMPHRPSEVPQPPRSPREDPLPEQ